MPIHTPRLSLVVAALAAVGLAAGCGSSTKPTSIRTSATTVVASSANTNGIDAAGVNAALAQYLSAPTSIPITTPLASKPAAGKVFDVISDGLTIEQEQADGVKAAAAVLGWKVNVLNASDSNPASYNSALLSAVNSGATAVSVTSVPTAYYSQALQAAQKAGVIVVDNAAGNAAQPGVIRIDNSAVAGPVWGTVYALGALADAASRRVPLHFLTVDVGAFDSVSAPIYTAAQNTISKYCSTCSFAELNVSTADLFGGKVPQDIVSYLQVHTDIDYLGFTFASTEIGVRAALDAASFGNVRIFGCAPDTPQFQELSTGKSHGWAVVPDHVAGWIMVDAVARQLANGSGVSAYAQAVAPTMLATPDNHPSPDIPIDYQAEFQKLWGLG